MLEARYLRVLPGSCIFTTITSSTTTLLLPITHILPGDAWWLTPDMCPCRTSPTPLVRPDWTPARHVVPKKKDMVAWSHLRYAALVRLCAPVE